MEAFARTVSSLSIRALLAHQGRYQRRERLQLRLDAGQSLRDGWGPFQPPLPWWSARKAPPLVSPPPVAPPRLAKPVPKAPPVSTAAITATSPPISLSPTPELPPLPCAGNGASSAETEAPDDFPAGWVLHKVSWNFTAGSTVKGMTYRCDRRLPPASFAQRLRLVSAARAPTVPMGSSVSSAIKDRVYRNTYGLWRGLRATRPPMIKRPIHSWQKSPTGMFALSNAGVRSYAHGGAVG
jgi:hypothetical protein